MHYPVVLRAVAVHAYRDARKWRSRLGAINTARPLTNQHLECITAKPNLTAERARQLFRYEPQTGILYRRHTDKEKVGTAKANGYLVVGVDGRLYLTHRIIWLIVYGRWPASNIDHVNRIKTDNRIENLRDVSQKLNMRNSVRSKKAIKVAGPVMRDGRWFAILPEHLASREMGPFATHEEAHAAFSKHAELAFRYEGTAPPRLRG